MASQSCCRRCDVEVHGHNVHLGVTHFLEGDVADVG